MRVLIPGGSGQVGHILTRAFVDSGDQVVVLSRNEKLSMPGAKVVTWDAKTLGDWTKEVDQTDVLINMSGRSVNCRYNSKNRQQMMDSRVDSTRVLGQAIEQSPSPPKTWLQASTATIYAHRFDAPNDEATGILGKDEPGAPFKWNFSIDVAQSWERACNEANTPNTRKVLLRSAMTMSPDRDGIFDVIYSMTKRGLGGKAGNGKQYVSWIHETDFINAVRFLINHEDMEGPVNLAAPNPLPHAEFMKTLRDKMGVKIGLPAFAWQLEIGAIFMKTETELLLKSRRVIPGRLTDAGFQFEYETWDKAAEELVNRRK